MFKNYIKTALRSLWKNKVFSFLNILGLAIGMAGFMLIAQYVYNELSYDKHHPDGIFRVQNDKQLNGELLYQSAVTYPAVGPAIKETSPEVLNFTRMWKIDGHVIFSYQDVNYNTDDFLFADQALLSIFNHPLVKGDQGTALSKPGTVILSESMAERIFGDEEPMDKTLTVISGADQFDLSVTGVFQDLPGNTHMSHEILISFATAVNLLGGQRAVMNNWEYAKFYTYLQLEKGTDPKTIEDRFAELVKKNTQTDQNSGDVFYLQPMKDIHLKSSLQEEIKVNGNATVVYFLSIVAVFILIIAWVNYINLSTAKALARGKEVGVRKVLGAVRHQLTRQFLTESILVNMLAAIAAVVIVQLIVPYYEDVTGSKLTLTLWLKPTFWLLLLLGFVSGGILSGLYPAFVLSGFRPVAVLKGKLSTSKGGVMLRKGLVIFQYVISAALIVGTFVVYRQLDFMQNQDLGLNIEKVVVLRAPSALSEDSTSVRKTNYFKANIEEYHQIQGMTATTETPGKEINLLRERHVRRLGERAEDANNYYLIGVDDDFFNVFEVDFLAGQNFYKGLHFYESVIINEEAASLLGFESPEDAVGQKINCFGVNKVLGVVKNYNQQSLQKSYDPIIFYLRDPKMLYSFYSVKLDTDNLSSTLSFIEGKWNEVFAGNPFEYFFLDEFFDQQYKVEKQFGKMFTLFSALAIFIASLGLFGLSSYSALQRAKEIGIRKVLGASVRSVFIKLSYDFIKLVLLAYLLAMPIIYFLMDEWLSGFAFKIGNTWWMYLLPLVLVVLMAIIAVSYQVLKCSLTNPVKVIRNE
ncbi:MAG: ABC transporter permease [Bacteroidota bacterium]